MKKLWIIIVVLVILFVSISILYGYSTKQIPKISAPKMVLPGEESQQETIDLPFCTTVEGCKEYFKSKGMTDAQINEYSIDCSSGTCKATVTATVVSG